MLVVGDGPAGSRISQRLAAAGASVACAAARRRAKPLMETVPARLVAGLPLDGARPCIARNASWRDVERVSRDAILDPDGGDLLVHRPALDAALRRAAATAGARFVDASITTLSRVAERWSVALEGHHVDARLVIDASGRSATVARRLGVRRLRLDRLCGLAVALRARAQRQTIDIVAAPGGWWYAGPGCEGADVAMFFTDVDLAQFTAARADLARVAAQTASLASWSLGEAPRAFDAASGRLASFAGEGWAAIGDAAFTVDPLSASGLTHALETADLAAEHTLAGTLDRYREALDARFRDYVHARTEVYTRVARFGAHAFWRRRREVLVPSIL